MDAFANKFTCTNKSGKKTIFLKENLHLQ